MDLKMLLHCKTRIGFSELKIHEETDYIIFLKLPYLKITI